MAGGAKAHPDGIRAFSETDFLKDKAIDVPVLLLHGEDLEIAPPDNSARKAIKLLRNGTLKSYPGLSHAPIHPDLVNADLLTFAKG